MVQTFNIPVERTVLLESAFAKIIKNKNTSNVQFWWFEAAALPLPIPNRVVKRRTANDTSQEGK